MKLFLKLLVLVACSVLISCSTAQRFYQAHTASPHQPWDGSSGKWGGYKESTASNGQFNIEYTAFNKPSREAVSYFTMVRAAERSLIEGHIHFFATQPIKLNSDSEQSYFPAYVIPGRWETEREQHCTRCRKTGERECHYDDVRVWYPAEYVPERYVTNYIHKSTMRIGFKSGGKKYNALEIASNALNNTKKFGKPKLDPRVMGMLKKHGVVK